jgi:hypothetical protein
MELENNAVRVVYISTHLTIHTLFDSRDAATAWAEQGRIELPNAEIWIDSVAVHRIEDYLDFESFKHLETV